MKSKFIISILVLVSSLTISCETLNSNTNDKDQFGSDFATGNNDFDKAYTVIREQCASCHLGYHNSYFSLKTEDDWIASGPIVTGDAANSELVERIINAGNANSNMPQNGTRLSDEDYNSIVDWINGL